MPRCMLDELAAAVHEDDGAAGFGDGEGQARIGQGAHVVDQVGAGPERALGHLALARVHGDRRVGGAAHGLQDGEKPGDLLFGGDFGSPGAVDSAARPGRLGPEVQQVGALLEHPERPLDCPRRIVPQSAVAERVGGEVQDAHDPRALSEGEGTATGEPEGPGGAVREVSGLHAPTGRWGRS